MKNLPPIKSIRKYCLWCCIDSKEEIKLCPIFNCSLHPYRLGKRNSEPASTPVKAIRMICLDCSVHAPSEVKNCEHTECSLYPFRLGKNPNRKGIGGNHSLNSNKIINSSGKE